MEYKGCEYIYVRNLNKEYKVWISSWGVQSIMIEFVEQLDYSEFINSFFDNEDFSRINGVYCIKSIENINNYEIFHKNIENLCYIYEIEKISSVYDMGMNGLILSFLNGNIRPNPIYTSRMRDIKLSKFLSI